MRHLVFAASLALVACKKDEAPPAAKTDAVTTTTAAAATPPKEGDAAPDVDLALQDGKHVKLASLRGKHVVLYFYPKDQTTGCTIEAQDFKARHDELVKAGVTVIGVSTQDAASHQSFIEKEQLPFSLAVDQDHAIAKAFGVPVSASGNAARQTVLIGKDGKVKKIWRDVTPKDHAAAVLAAAGAA